MKSIKLLCLFVLITTLSACGGGGGANDNNDNNDNNTGSAVLKSNLDISFSDINSFMVGSGSVSTSSVGVNEVGGSGSSQLYVVLSNNTIQQVSLTLGGSYEVLGVVDTDTYTFFSVSGITYGGVNCQLIPVRKSDGAMFCIDVVLHQPNFGNDVFENSPVQKLLSSDVFYVWTGASWDDSSIIKLDLTDPNNATQSTPFNLSGRHIRDFNINSSGDAIIWSDGDSDGYVQVFKTVGGIVNVQPYHNVSCAYLSSGPQGYSHQDDFYLITDKLYFVPKTTTFVKDEIVGQLTFNMGCSVGYEVKLLGKIFLLPVCGDGAFYELAKDTGDVTVQHASAVITNITAIYGMVDRIYALGTDGSGNGGVVYYDINADTWTTVLTPGDYTVSEMQVDSSGDVLFYGVRNSDGATVIGKVFTSGSLVILSANTNLNVQSIVRIN